jgi:hypothetical protein
MMQNWHLYDEQFWRYKFFFLANYHLDILYLFSPNLRIHGKSGQKTVHSPGIDPAEMFKWNLYWSPQAQTFV